MGPRSQRKHASILTLAMLLVGFASFVYEPAVSHSLLPTAHKFGAPRSPNVARRASTKPPLRSLTTIIVGAGPSGLLLAHRLLEAGATVQIFDSRPDPRSAGGALEGRAYALGLGIRGRTAIRTVDDELWNAIKLKGFASERFKLHLSSSFAIDLRTPEESGSLEPSILLYQSDLCAAMLDELEKRYSKSERLNACFGAKVESVDPLNGIVTLEHTSTDGSAAKIQSADLIAGCDGVNSIVRKTLEQQCEGLEVSKEMLPGCLKVLRFPEMPAALDPSAVHAIPGGGGSSAFVEPTAEGACALINWRPNEGSSDKRSESKEGATVDLGSLTDPAEAAEVLKAKFPMISDMIDLDSGRQFVEQSSSRAATVKCNTYHFGTAVLLGDAAHSTGGASGQGCNSALQDSASLADILEQTGGHVAPALLEYSQARVPEGHALLDLSLGPKEGAGPIQRVLYGLATLRDFIFGRLKIGEPSLQVELTTTLTPFTELRRKRDFFFGEFPPQSAFDDAISSVIAREPSP